MNDVNVLNAFVTGLWDLFSTFNGNPDMNNYGIRLSMGMFFSAFLLIVIKMRAISTMDRKHIVAMIGALLIFFRYAVMFIFEWGYQIGLYEDKMVKFLFPPIEHYFYMIGLGCMAYYSLNHYQYYPGLLKRWVWGIPTFITWFFIYATITWKNFFMDRLPTISSYLQCEVDWMSHGIITIMAMYVFIVSVIRITRTNNHWLSLFWFVTICEHSTRTLLFYNHIEPSWLATIFHACQIWSLPILILHFIKIYVVKLKYCEICLADGAKTL